MKHTTLLVSVALVVAAVAMVPLGGLAAGEDAEAGQQASNDSVAPGQRLSGVVAVGQTELETDVDARAFNLSVARAATDEARADVVQERFRTIEERFTRLQERKRTLDQARENGSMSEGAYRARVTELAAGLEGTERLANATERAAGDLPAAVLEEKGIDVEAMRTLREQANELGGREVADIARDIAGPSVGKAPGHAGPDDRGSPARTDRPGGSDAGAGTPGGNRTAGPNTGTAQAD